MGKGELSHNELLAFVRHDFLNDLQIILMHLDLENPSEARKAILKTTNSMNQQSLLSGLGLPKVQQWLLTFDWVYTAYSSTLSCAIKRGTRKVNDEKLVTHLTSVFTKVEEVIDPLYEYDVDFDIFADEQKWSIKITIKGELPETEKSLVSTDDINVEESFSHNLWMFELSGH